MKYLISFKDHLLFHIKKQRKKIKSAKVVIEGNRFILFENYSNREYIEFLKNINIFEYDIDYCYGSVIYVDDTYSYLDIFEGRQGLWQSQEEIRQERDQIEQEFYDSISPETARQICEFVSHITQVESDRNELEKLFKL